MTFFTAGSRLSIHASMQASGANPPKGGGALRGQRVHPHLTRLQQIHNLKGILHGGVNSTRQAVRRNVAMIWSKSASFPGEESNSMRFLIPVRYGYIEQSGGPYQMYTGTHKPFHGKLNQKPAGRRVLFSNRGRNPALRDSPFGGDVAYVIILGLTQKSFE